MWITRDDLDRTYVSVPAMGPGKRTGSCRRGTDQFLVHADGNSAISAEDYLGARLDGGR